VVINQLVSAILRDTKRVYPVSIPLTGQYGYQDVSISVPCVIGKNGVEKILEVPLSNEEKKLMDKSVKILKETII
jgi:malate/lactate dehydrogenase